jgi:flagellar protein FlgJ
MTKEEFIAAATAAAQASSATSGFPPGVTVAQAALESAWGNSQLARVANNYFGIKAHANSAWVTLPTYEYRAGRKRLMLAKFARYASMLECFADRDQHVLRLPCYAEACRVAKEPVAFIKGLAKFWATDPKYADKLLLTYNNHRLFKLDEPFVFGKSSI